jgi:hypothetical protein
LSGPLHPDLNGSKTRFAMSRHSISRRDLLKAMAGGVGLQASGLLTVPRVHAARSENPLRLRAGRQIFVDDYLIAHTSLRRTFHYPKVHDASPVLKPETPLEMNDGYCPVACPFQDGVFYDPKDRLYKVWYHAGWFDGTAYAYSEDGLSWTRPNLDIEPGTNRVLPRNEGERDGAGAWLDLQTTNPAERYKMFVYYRQFDRRRETGASVAPSANRAALGRQVSSGGSIYTSSDGVHWTHRGPTGPCGDNTNFHYDPFRKRWFYSVRVQGENGELLGGSAVRKRAYRECVDFVQGAQWAQDDLVLFAAADDEDLPDPVVGDKAQLYNVDAIGYESLMLGVFTIHRGPANNVGLRTGIPKITDLTLAYSRDGLHWQRPDRSAFLACSRQPDTWNRGYLHSNSAVCVIAGDELRFYFSAFSGQSPRLGGHMYAGGAMGLATLRRDGFASMDAAAEPGSLTTPLLDLDGRYLFVNANARGGELTAEILGPDGKVLPGLAKNNCQPIRGDRTCQRVSWKGASDLGRLRGQPVSLRFHAVNAALYAFWVGPDESGASHGYVAAGGPGFTGPTDTIGRRQG